MSQRLWIDPLRSTNGSDGMAPNVFAADGEFMAAIAGLKRTTQLLVSLPDQLFLELYAYEMLERTREAVTSEHEGGCSVPFWPECLFWAADIHAHPCNEIQRMLPVFEPVVVVDCGEAVIARAAEQTLGAVRFDPARYRQRLLTLAARSGWEVRQADIHPTHRTAGAVIAVNGKVLLEKRSQDALVYPGCWDTPGGHVEAGEDPEQTLMREMHEELGIVIEKCFLGAVQDDRVRERTAGRVYRHYVYVVDRFRGVPEPLLHQPLGWWPVDKLLRARMPDLNPLMVSAVRRFAAAGWI